MSELKTEVKINCFSNFLGYSLESKDELVDALPTLKQRAAQDDANILFSVASDLAKVKQNLTLQNSPFVR